LFLRPAASPAHPNNCMFLPKIRISRTRSFRIFTRTLLHPEGCPQLMSSQTPYLPHVSQPNPTPFEEDNLGAQGIQPEALRRASCSITCHIAQDKTKPYKIRKKVTPHAVEKTLIVSTSPTVSGGGSSGGHPLLLSAAPKVSVVLKQGVSLSVLNLCLTHRNLSRV